MANCLAIIMESGFARPFQLMMRSAHPLNYPVDLKLIDDRLRNGFYRTNQAILFDARAFLDTALW